MLSPQDHERLNEIEAAITIELGRIRAERRRLESELDSTPLWILGALVVFPFVLALLKYWDVI